MIQQPGVHFRSHPAIFFFDACFRYVKLSTVNEDNIVNYVAQAGFAGFDEWM